MSSKEPSSKVGTSTFINAGRKTSLFGNMKRKQSNNRGEIATTSYGKNEEKKMQRGKSVSSFDSDFNSEGKPSGGTGSGNHNKLHHDPIRRTSSHILNPQIDTAHEMIDDSFAGGNEMSISQ
jgi:hypothetical protein